MKRPRCDVLHPILNNVKCQLIIEHRGNHINDDGYGRRQSWEDDTFAAIVQAEVERGR